MINIKHTSNLSEYFTAVCTIHKNKTALRYKKKYRQINITYLELLDLSKKFASFLQKSNIKKGDRILIQGSNQPGYVVSLIACSFLGAVLVPVDIRTRKETFLKYIKKTKPTFAITSRYIRQIEFVNGIFIEDVLEIAEHNKPYNKKNSVKRNDLFEIIFTSGTTADPKGVMLSHGNILSNCESIVQIIPKLKYLETLSVLPLSHMFEQIINLMAMTYYGGTVIFIDKVNSITISKALYYSKCSHLAIVPQIMKSLVRSIEKGAKNSGNYTKYKRMLQVCNYLPFSLRKLVFNRIHSQFGNNLKFIIVGGATLDLPSAKKLEQMGIKVIEGYGATEVTAVATAPISINKRKLGSIGKPIANVQIKLVDDEIFIKGPNVAQGYYKDQKLTNEYFVDKWYKTGDVGKFDSKQNLYFKGRDAFKIVLSSGENVYAEDIEKKICNHPSVIDAVVCAKQSQGKELIHAYFILREGSVLDKVVKEVNLSLESKQQIRSYELWPDQDFPRTRTLKIDRKKIKNKANKIIEKSLTMEETISDPLIHILTDISRTATKIKEDMSLSMDLNLDSLDRAEVVARVEEEFGVEINDFDINMTTTIKELRQKIELGSKQSVRRLNLNIFKTSSQIIKLIFQTFFLFPVHRTFVKIKVIGKQNIIKIQSPCIIIFNHVGLLDGACCLRILPLSLRRKVAVGSSDDFWSKGSLGLVGKFLTLSVSGFPIQSAGPEQIGHLFDREWMLLTSPEGQLQRQGELQEFKKGVAYFAQLFNVPIIPMKISENYSKIAPAPKIALGKAKISQLFPKKSGKVTVKVGQPIIIPEGISTMAATSHIQKIIESM